MKEVYLSLVRFFFFCVSKKTSWSLNLWFLINQYLFPDVLLCRKCGHTIAEEHQAIEIKSLLASGYKNASVFGKKGMLVQTFKNPGGLFCKIPW